MRYRESKPPGGRVLVTAQRNPEGGTARREAGDVKLLTD